MIPILYLDDFLLVCCKPVGLVSEADCGKGMPDLLSAQLREAGEADFVAGVHRLDKAVGGAMVFSRKKDVTGKLIGQVAQRQMEKIYLAVLRGVPEAPAATLEDLLFHDSRTNKTFIVDRPRKGVREAKLDYRVLAESEGLSLVRVRLHTGRTHQIRAQFASRGLPLLGDIRYGSRADCTPALWAWHLRFRHPKTGNAVDVLCPPPDKYPWTLFPIPKEDAP